MAKKSEEVIQGTEAVVETEKKENVLQVTESQLMALIKAAIEEDRKKAEDNLEPAVDEKTEEQKKLKAYYDELVTINLFMDNDKYKDDVIVAVNGKVWQIKRGEDVKVPRHIAEVINNSAKQDRATALEIRKLEEKYENESKYH